MENWGRFYFSVKTSFLIQRKRGLSPNAEWNHFSSLIYDCCVSPTNMNAMNFVTLSWRATKGSVAISSENNRSPPRFTPRDGHNTHKVELFFYTAFNLVKSNTVQLKKLQYLKRPDKWHFLMTLLNHFNKHTKNMIYFVYSKINTNMSSSTL